ncbi:MAG: excinuclease ABC subunit UvrC [Kiritimatiellae bacterium]|nr:excinuclease ABC subunit UvrC [Kiritimatiellia bacterium]MDW8458648.1 excinuclease ABC subunit UvrC [Verrucomicrobiota bacterium]
MELPDAIKQKLQTLPDQPGVYIMRDKHGQIIYVGKASSLRNRVRHYFQRATLRSADPKLRGLIRGIADFDVIPVRSEAEAILTEGRMIKEYRPRYNVYFRDDKRFLLLRIHLDDPWPRFELCRIDRRDGALYFGPYASSRAARTALDFVQRRFGIRECRPRIPGPDDHKHCHADIVRFCSAPCIGAVSAEEYRRRVMEAISFLRGERPELLGELEAQMRDAAERMDYEEAAALRDTLLLLRRAIRERARGTGQLHLKPEDAKAGLQDLRIALNLNAPPRVIECFDISNISGTYAVGSMVVAVDGIPARNRYRRFRIKTVLGIDDPAMMAEVIRRRYTRVCQEGLALPDLILVDGGVTQLNAARAELAALGLGHVPTAGLAKRFEELHVDPALSAGPVRLPRNSMGLRVLQQIRDEAHRFALDYHRRVRARRIRDSLLDEIEGVGEKRKELLLKHFGSVTRLARASESDIAALPGIGPQLARVIKDVLNRRLAHSVDSPAPS